MSKKFLLIFLVAALLLPGCSNSSEPTYAPIAVTTKSNDTIEHVDRVDKDDESEEVDLEELPIDPPYNFDIDSMKASDFGAFESNYGSTTSTYKIMSGDDICEHEVTVIKGRANGPSVYVIAGIHGDEEAAWRAGNLLKKVSIKAGTLYVLSPANNPGSKTHKRKIDGVDPNRVWPGNSNGNAAERNAAGIFADVKDKKPDFVFDLHEARIVRADGDSLASSITYTTLDNWPDGLYFDFMADTEAGLVTTKPFHSDSPSPSKSVNESISTKLNIPTVTVETFRGYQMKDRLTDQLAVVEYVLQYFRMVD